MGGSNPPPPPGPREPGQQGDLPGAPDGDDCFALQFQTVLQQPAQGPVHQPGSVLEILPIAEANTAVLAAVGDAGDVVGTVVEGVADLLLCTSAGVAYVADVTDVEFGIHTVRVRAARGANAERDYRIVGATNGTHALSLMGDDPGVGIAASTGVLAAEGICELRALLRAGVSFNAVVVDDVATVTE